MVVNSGNEKHDEYVRHKDKYIKRAKLWAKNNPDKRQQIVKRNNEKSADKKREWHELKMFGMTIKRESCSICGAVPINKSGLVVHHADGQNGKNGNSLNNSPDNLAVICRKCHPKVHYRGEIRSLTI